VGGRLSVSMIMCVVLFGHPSTIEYPALTSVVVETFVEILSVNQVGALGMGVSRM
jgi:hypothetical protein